MALRGKNSSIISELMAQPDEVTPFIRVYIKEEHPEAPIKERYTSEQQPSNIESSVERKLEPRCIKNEWATNGIGLLNEDEDPLAEKPDLLASEFHSNKCISLDKRMKLYIEKKLDIKEEVEDLLPEELLIKVEDEGECKTKDDVDTINGDETASNSSGSANLTKRSQSSNKIACFKRSKWTQRSLVCDECGYRCERRSTLKRHLMKHSGEKPFSCDRCVFRSASKQGIKQHQVRHSSEKPFACSQCDYKTGYLRGLKRHLVTHSGEKPFACEQCDYRTTRKANLTQHRMQHLGVKQLACDQCDYRTAKLGNLKKHQLIHSGQKPFACDQCDYQCTQKGSLHQHQLKHSGKKPFACGQCDYKTARAVQLKQHQFWQHSMKHSEQTPFSCDQCSFTTAHVYALKRHQTKHL